MGKTKEKSMERYRRGDKERRRTGHFASSIFSEAK
jgi:hypothetical protein